MEDKQYEYHGLIASSWDLLRGDTSSFPDRHFFRKIIQDNGQPALDVGCGTGRLLLEYLADGFDVDGVDVSPEMLEICRQKAEKLSLAPKLYAQPMELLDLPRQYATIIVTSSSFQLVTDQAKAFQALRRFHHHLKTKGLLVMSIMEVSEDVSEDWVLVGEKPRPEDGLMVRRWEQARYDPADQLKHTENRYELIEDSQVIYSELHQRSPELRVYSLDQISDLLKEAGFKNVRAVSGFSHEPATTEDSVFCMFGER